MGGEGMNLLSTGSSLLGGLGLFLLGMWLMTDGLKLAAGNALREILAEWTSTRTRGLIAGFLVTALVQSSSAVTVATIGFANAGLLTLEQAVWAIFGSNVGTTMTGWIVALIGFKLNVEAFALPIVGIGMLLRLTGEDSKRGSIGQAMVGFGLLFLGIGVLKESFDAVGSQIQLPGTKGAGLEASVAYVLFGVLLTTLMQSSSAAMVVTLSAAEGDLITINAAAQVVIGANLGTTTTALLAVLRATPTARRVAASHVIFNLLTAVVAVVTIVPILGAVAWVQELLALSRAPAVTLALFHTAFNVLGVCLMIPVAPRMVPFLEQRFKTVEEKAARPKYIDDTALQVPALAVDAVLREIQRIGEQARAAVQAALSAEHQGGASFSADLENVRSLSRSVGTFIGRLNQRATPPQISNVLPEALRTMQSYRSACELAVEVANIQEDLSDVDDPELHEQLIRFRKVAIDAIQAAAAGGGESPAAEAPWEAADSQLEAAYEPLKNLLLRAGASARLSVVKMEALMREAAAIRRAVRHLLKGTKRLVAIRDSLSGENGGSESEEARAAAAVLDTDEL